MEGEMFAPAAQIKLGTFDRSALVVDPIQPSSPSSSVPAMQGTQTAPTSKPLKIESDISLPLSPSWAIENRSTLTQTLRAVLSLRADEDLVITRISAARRLNPKTRKLQEGGSPTSVKIEFLLGLTQSARATQAQSALTALSTGQPQQVQAFTTQLDSQLQAAGKPVVALSPQTITFSGPRAREEQTSGKASPSSGTSSAAAWSWTPTAVAQSPQYNTMSSSQHGDDGTTSKNTTSSSETPLLLILGCSAAGIVFFLWLGKCRIATDEQGSHIVFGGNGRRPPQQQEMPSAVAGEHYQGKTSPA
jgi:hypothetical protein